MTPKEECEELMNSVLPIAVSCLEKRGEFFPFGAVMTIDKNVVLNSPSDGNERPESKDVIVDLERIHKKLAEDNEIIASSIIYEAKMTLNDSIEDAIIISLEHKDDYNINIAFPYVKKKKLFKNIVEIYDPIGIEGSKNIF